MAGNLIAEQGGQPANRLVGVPTPQPAPRPGGRSPWVAMGVILVGVYAAVLNTTVVGVAMPSIADDLRGGFLDVDWVVTAFLIGVVLALVATGWLADSFGRKPIFSAGLGVFGLGALVCTVAPTMELLVLGRFVQGLGSGALMPVGTAMVMDLFPPHRRGGAFGAWGIAMTVAPAAGQPLGGWITDVASWRWIFFTFVVVAALAVALALRWLPKIGHVESRHFDLVGYALAAPGVVAVVLGLRQAVDWGITSAAVLTAAIGGSVLLGIFVGRSLRRPDPIIELRMLTVPTFGVGMIIALLTSLAMFAAFTFVPVELQVVRGLEAQRVGLLMAPMAIGSAVTLPIGGWLVDRVGARVPVCIGLALAAAGLWQLGHLTPGRSLATVVQALVVMGAGMGLAFTPATVAAMNSVPGRFIAQASVINNLIRQLGGAVSVALLGAVVVAELGAVSPSAPDIEVAQVAYNRCFLVAFWATVASAVVALALPGARGVREHHAARAVEQWRQMEEGTEERLDGLVAEPAQERANPTSSTIAKSVARHVGRKAHS